MVDKNEVPQGKQKPVNRRNIFVRLLDRIFLVGPDYQDPDSPEKAAVSRVQQRLPGGDNQEGDLARLALLVSLIKFFVGCLTLIAICSGLFYAMADVWGKETTVWLRGFGFLVPLGSAIVTGLFGGSFVKLRSLKKKRLISAGGVIIKLQDSLEQSKKEGQVLSESVQDLQTRNTLLAEEKAALKREAEELRESKSCLDEECQDLERKNRGLDEDLARLRQEYDTLKRQDENQQAAVVARLIEQASNTGEPQREAASTAPLLRDDGGSATAEREEMLNALTVLYRASLRGLPTPTRRTSMQADPIESEGRVGGSE